MYTLPPVALTPLFDLAAGLVFDAEAIERDVPADSLARITQTPYGLQSYDPNGMSQNKFSPHPATIFTVTEFSTSAIGLEEYVAGRIGASPDRDVPNEVGTATGGTRQLWSTSGPSPVSIPASPSLT